MPDASITIHKFGRWSALFSLAFSLIYIVGQLAEWLGLLGSGGGPESASTAIGLIVLLTPSLFLGVSFTVLMGEVESVRLLLFTPFDSFLYSVDVLGYSFMSFSTLFAGFVFTERKERKARWFMIANGLIAPFLALQIYYHALIWPASLWGVTFPGAMISLAIVFKKPLVPQVITN